MYEDDLDNSEDIVYTGQGGHDLLGSRHQVGDQKLERGNLALKVCSELVLFFSYLKPHSIFDPIVEFDSVIDAGRKRI